MFFISNYCFIVIGFYKGKTFIIIILYCFYLFSVFWPIKVVTILIIGYSVIIKCFLLDSFTEYIIILLKLFVNVCKDYIL